LGVCYSTYIKSEQLFQCPSETGTTATGATLADRAIVAGFSDYYYNFNLGNLSESSVEYASNTIMNGDGAQVGTNNGTAGIGGAAQLQSRQRGKLSLEVRVT
jgi:hypothetical protein